MNWTEGNLARHSRGRQRNELLTRQKQHFAKVRNNLLRGGVKQSPISISFIGTQHSQASGRRDGSGGPSSRPQSSPLLVEKRKRSQDVRGDLEGQSSIREKRKRLLDKADWVGLDLQQPIDITFPGQLQASTGSRWSRVDRPRIHAVRKRREIADTPQLEATQVHSPRLKVQVGSQEIHPSMSTTSQPMTRRYSLAPRPLVTSSLTRSNPISSPEPSHARHLYVPSGSSQTSQIPEAEWYKRATERKDFHLKAPMKPPIPEEPSHVAYSSSVIHEPAPLRANDFLVLQWSPSGSEDRGSMQVEIERPVRPVPQSQEADQEIWKNWVVSSSDTWSIEVSATPQATASSISSKVLPSHLQTRLPSYDVSSEPAMSINYQFSELSTNDQPSETAIHQGNHQLSEQRSDHAIKQVQPADDNEAWMKFAFDGDSDEIEAKGFAEAAQQAAAELHPSDVSTSGVDMAETTATYGTDSLATDVREQNKDCPPETSSESHMATHGTVASESTSSNVATAGSTAVAESESRFRFAQPRTFVGKLADSTAIARGPSLLSRPGKKGRGRQGKRIVDGRTDIRRLPDFDGDPIEEFGEDR
ncbi:hypothetical protein F4677DRAFT_343419 [Hypoxylon crocopeplum]|nr:hypothetical protein F4677DRAFT_343419 [Hypoxylon crocopeplum]